MSARTRSILLFLGLLAVFTVWRFPHRRLVHTLVAASVAPFGVDVTIEQVGYAFPFGYRILGIHLSEGDNTMTLASLVAQPRLRGVHLRAETCKGRLEGSLGTREVDLAFSDLDPASCVRGGQLKVSGAFSGRLTLQPAARTSRQPASRTEGSLTLRSPAGTVSGSLSAGPAGSPFALGEWEYREGSATVRIVGNEIRIPEARALSQGIEWRLERGRLRGPGRDAPVSADLRARATGKSARAKAVFALLPKAGTGSDGWKHYRLGGTIAAPTLVGLR